MSFENLPPLFDDVIHQELDEAVNQATEYLRPASNQSPHVLQSLLHYIIDNSYGMLDCKYLLEKEGAKLIDTHLGLREMLSIAWEKKSYREIRNLAILRSPESSLERLVQSCVECRTFPWYFNFGNYRGAAVDGLHQYLTFNEKLFNAREGDEKNYAKFCTIIQSPGTGKSRMLTELGRKDVIVIYMNVRDKPDEYGFPPRDQIPANILQSSFWDNGDAYRARCYAFFIALFNTIEGYLSEYLATENAKTTILNWGKRMCNTRNPPVTARTDFFEKLYYDYIKVDTHVGDTALSDLLVESFKKMSTSLAQTFPDHSFKPKLVIAIDDPDYFTAGHNNHRRVDALHRVVKQYSHCETRVEAVWVVLASTNPEILPRDTHKSGGVATQGEKFFPPFTQLGWDQNASPIEGVEVGNISLVGHIAGYGRPLWLSLKNVGHASKGVRDLAMKKLLHADLYDPRQTDHVLALLGQRFAINLTFGHPDAVENLKNGVINHLRVYHATTMDRNWMTTSYPSEPLLSCIAAMSLHRSDELLRVTMETFSELVKQGMIDMDQHVELASRFLWLLAKDLYVRIKLEFTNRFPPQWDGRLTDCRMICVVDWLEFVFGPQIWGDENGKTSLAHKTFKNAYVNFSHWVCMDTILAGSGDEDGLPLDPWTLRHFQRTSAVQCCRQQPLVHKVIPMYFNVESATSAKGQMSQIFISESVRESSDSKDKLRSITRRHRNIGGHTSTSDSGSLPYIVIMADFGQPPSFSATFAKEEVGDRCLRVYAAGIDASTYPFLGSYQQVVQTLQDLVHMKEVPETARSYAKYLDA